MLESSPIIREANLCDAPRLADIYNYYITQTTVTFETEAITAEEMQHRIAEVKEQGLPYLVCECLGKIVGYSYVHPWRTRAAFLHSKELSVYFDHTCRHQGWGSQIVRAMIAACRACQVHALIATVTSENVESLHFHQRLGFRHVGHFDEVGWKFDHWIGLDAFQLTLEARREQNV